MKTTTTFIKTKLTFVSLILFSATALFYSGCDKDDDEETPTCNDGIQNQGETGVDCGGPCAACHSVTCHGNSENKFLPLANNNYWKYSDLDASSAHYSLTVNGTQVFGSNTYHVVAYCYMPPSCMLNDTLYIRHASNGDAYQYFSNLSAEYLLVPANPTMNQTWPFPVNSGIGERKVMSLNESISTYDCSYTGSLKIQEYTALSQPWKAY